MDRPPLVRHPPTAARASLPTLPEPKYALIRSQTIYLMFRNTDVSNVTTLYLHVAEARQNTSPASAHVITALPFRVTASWLQPRLWYRFTAPKEMWIRASVAFDEEAGLRVWTGTTGALRDAGCESLVEGTNAASRLTAARMYYLEAWHEASSDLMTDAET